MVGNELTKMGDRNPAQMSFGQRNRRMLLIVGKYRLQRNDIAFLEKANEALVAADIVANQLDQALANTINRRRLVGFVVKRGTSLKNQIVNRRVKGKKVFQADVGTKPCAD